MDKVSDRIMDTVKRWESEAFNPRNDGWIQNGYRKNLIELREHLNSIKNLELHGG